MSRTSGTVEKALDILDIFIAAKNPCSVSQLAAATGIHISTVVRLCTTLEARNYLRRCGRGIYDLGTKVGELERAYESRFDLESVLRPILAELRDASGESASFHIRDKDERICLFRENSLHAIGHHVEQGARLPLRIGVAGRVLMAFSGEEGEQFQRIREDGFLEDAGREPFTASVAVPLLTRGGRLLGAITISGLENRFTRENRERAKAQALSAAAFLTGHIPENVRV